MTSIKKQLLISILTIMCIGTLIMVSITYLELKEELDELFDENIKQVAHSIALHDFAKNENFSSHTPQDTRQNLKGEEEFLIQVWKENELVYSSLPALDFPLQNEGGVKTVIQGDQKWRYYGIKQENWLVQVSQPIPVRHSVIWEIYIELLLPMLIQLPIILAVIALAITKGFKPVKKVSNLIEQRNPAFLGHIPSDNVPYEIKTMVDALNDLLGKLDQSIKAQKRFTADAAHELRTPLTALSLQLDVLRRSKTESEKQEAIEALYKGVDRSTHLVRQLLELARQEPDAIENLFQECALDELVDEVIQEYATLAEAKAININIIKSEECFIKGDPHALKIMIGNLIKNAIHYTPEKGIIELSLYKNENNQIAFEVADNGIGIAETERARVFDRFYRVTGTKESGSGIGLSIVQAIAERHGTEVTVENGINSNGTSFKLIFP